jgi:uncharacterized protein with HEPN domain
MRDRLRLADVLEAIGRIEKYSQQGRAAFDDSELIRVWILHHLEIMGEACRGLSDDFGNANPDELWSDVVSFRNVLARQYFGFLIREGRPPRLPTQLAAPFSSRNPHQFNVKAGCGEMHLFRAALPPCWI